MIKATTYLDKRKADKNELFSLYLVLTKNGTKAMSFLGIKLSAEQWENGKVVKHPRKDFLNTFISAKMGDVNKAILELTYNGSFVNKTAKESLQILNEHMDPELAAKRLEAERKQSIEANSFARFFRKHMEGFNNEGTKGLYEDTYNKLSSFCQFKGIDFRTVSFAEINKKWLESFELYCLMTQRQNTASRHLRDIRAVFNAAIEENATSCYPFRKFKIQKEETIDKSYTAKELHALFTHNCFSKAEQEAVDMFKLMFCLIGINSIDLAKAEEPKNGRLNYVRAKTHKPYSIKIEPEAQHLIHIYRGKEGKLVHILDKSPNYKTYFNRMGKTLRKVGLIRQKGKKNTGRALLPDICVGSARTSWATIAQEELDIPREVIAAALGHHTVDVTSTYLRTDWKNKVDKANRMVLNWVFYRKKKRLYFSI